MPCVPLGRAAKRRVTGASCGGDLHALGLEAPEERLAIGEVIVELGRDRHDRCRAAQTDVDCRVEVLGSSVLAQQRRKADGTLQRCGHAPASPSDGSPGGPSPSSVRTSRSRARSLRGDRRDKRRSRSTLGPRRCAMSQRRPPCARPTAHSKRQRARARPRVPRAHDGAGATPTFALSWAPAPPASLARSLAASLGCSRRPQSGSRDLDGVVVAATPATGTGNNAGGGGGRWLRRMGILRDLHHAKIKRAAANKRASYDETPEPAEPPAASRRPCEVRACAAAASADCVSRCKDGDFPDSHVNCLCRYQGTTQCSQANFACWVE